MIRKHSQAGTKLGEWSTPVLGSATDATYYLQSCLGLYIHLRTENYIICHCPKIVVTTSSLVATTTERERACLVRESSVPRLLVVSHLQSMVHCTIRRTVLYTHRVKYNTNNCHNMCADLVLQTICKPTNWC